LGILKEPLDFVRALPLSKGFAVCELGDQWITYTDPHRLAREFYEQDMRCGRYEAIDGNARGTIMADLNLRLSKKLRGAFDLVTDFGTGEHIFDQRQVWNSVHDMTKAGGYIAFDRPTQGYAVHCYYNTNMCLFEDLAAANGYKVINLEQRPGSRGELIRGVFKKLSADVFRVPQQGRYKKTLKI
jgi:hypothetical protein